MGASPSTATVDRTATEPLWIQVYRLLAEQIITGALRPNSRLPVERDLCADAQVSRVTVRRALQELAAEGLIERSPTRGWYVAGRELTEPPNVLQSWSATAAARGFRPTTRVLELRRRPATLEDSEGLQVAPGTDVVDLHRLRKLDGVPFALDRSVLPVSRFPDIDHHELADRSLYELLERVYQTVPTRADYSVGAAGANATDAALLEIAPGSPVVVATQSTYDGAGIPIEFGHLVYPAGRYRFQATLVRPQLAPIGRRTP